MDCVEENNPLIKSGRDFDWKKSMRDYSSTCLLVAGIFCLMCAIWGGLVRIGWHLSDLRPGLPAIHGPLVVCGFLGTLFSFERASSLKKGWAYLSPALIALGALSLLIKPEWVPSTQLVTAGSLGFLLICLASMKGQFNLFTLMIAIGSALWLGGIVIWLARWPVFNVYLWWMSFVLFTLVGERLEMAHRIRLNNPPYKILIAAMAAVLAGQILMVSGHIASPDNMGINIDAIVDPRLVLGMKVGGIGMIMTAMWLLCFDASWTIIKNGGMAGYVSLCLISGYIWLGCSGVFSFAFAGFVSGVRYDALLHSFFVGFVWFVLFAHGPIAIISGLSLRVRNVNTFFFLAMTLHFTLALRIFGDMFRLSIIKKSGGLLNAVVIISFVLTLVIWIMSEKLIPNLLAFARARLSLKIKENPPEAHNE